MGKLLNTELQDEVWRRVTEILGGDDSGQGIDGDRIRSYRTLVASGNDSTDEKL